MSQHPLVSIVTPVHNTADYLEECIQSVLGQSYVHFEYIIVENQSTDGSGDIADEYARLDRRIKVIRTERLLSQVENYNFALSQVSQTSEYTKMCQADDWLLPRCVEEMVDLAAEHPSVGLVSSYSMTGARVDNIGLPIWTTRLDGREACALYLRDMLFLFGTPSTVMYRSDLVRARQPFFDSGRLHEDTEVCFELLEKSDFGFVHQILSVCREHEGSITDAASDLLPEAIDRVIVVKTHGRQHLDERDFETAEKSALDEYYRSLARRVLRRMVRPHHDGFWAYQRRGLALAGERLSPWRLARSLLRVTIEGLLSPLVAIQKVRGTVK